MKKVALFAIVAATFCSSMVFAQETAYRVDCRFHNTEALPGVKFCYASATYDVDDSTEAVTAIHLGVGCDNETFYDDSARITPTEVGTDRISPPTAAVPALEIPNNSGGLTRAGVYQSTLDILNFGRMDGRCYVTKGAALPAVR